MIDDADVGLIPLRISGGTDIMLPTKLLEYVFVGIPCIAPRTGTIARYFDDEMVEFFEAENVDSLADAIVRLHRDSARRSRLAAEATRRFANAYRWSEHKKVYTTLVTRLLDEAAGAATSSSAAEGRVDVGLEGERLAAQFQDRRATDPEVEQAGRFGLVSVPEVAAVEHDLDPRRPPGPEVGAGEFLVGGVQDDERRRPPRSRA